MSLSRKLSLPKLIKSEQILNEMLKFAPTFLLKKYKTCDTIEEISNFPWGATDASSLSCGFLCFHGSIN